MSSETEIPYRYYRMPFCKPVGGVKKASSTVNPGTILLGIRINNSPYSFSVMVGGGCLSQWGVSITGAPHLGNFPALSLLMSLHRELPHHECLPAPAYML